MLTVSDLRNPKRQSGFDYVGRAGDSRKWRGQRNAGAAYGTTGKTWRGPSRKAAEEAAQDYCDYVNGEATPATPAALKSAGHVGKRARLVDPELRSAYGMIRDIRAQEEGKPGYVYLIGEAEGDYAVKIGYSTNPQARLAELQTGNPRLLVLLAYAPGTLDDEGRLHARYNGANILQEWFAPSRDLYADFGLAAEWVDRRPLVADMSVTSEL